MKWTFRITRTHHAILWPLVVLWAVFVTGGDAIQDVQAWEDLWKVVMHQWTTIFWSKS